MNLCINCNYCAKEKWAENGFEYLCSSPNVAMTSPVTGDLIKISCPIARDDKGVCGPDGRFFEEKTKYAPKDGDCSGDLRKASPEEMFELGKKAGEDLLTNIKK